MNIKQTEMEGGGWQHIKRRDGAKRQHTGMNMKQVEFSSRRRGGGLRLVHWSITRSSMTLKHTQGHTDKSHRRQRLRCCSSSCSSGTAAQQSARRRRLLQHLYPPLLPPPKLVEEEQLRVIFGPPLSHVLIPPSVSAARFKCQSYFR